jgi:hypothetical protein
MLNPNGRLVCTPADRFDQAEPADDDVMRFHATPDARSTFVVRNDVPFVAGPAPGAGQSMSAG